VTPFGYMQSATKARIGCLRLLHRSGLSEKTSLCLISRPGRIFVLSRRLEVSPWRKTEHTDEEDTNELLIVQDLMIVDVSLTASI
jgi:hypothetical protein